MIRIVDCKGLQLIVGMCTGQLQPAYTLNVNPECMSSRNLVSDHHFYSPLVLFEQDDIIANLWETTRHVCNYWRNLATVLKDGNETLEQLKILLGGVKKTTRCLAG
jgi:hypothetical protein